MKHITVLTGAGISAESGISTFRDSNGLWENHEVMDVASPEGWEKDRKLVIDFYNARRRQLKEVFPNKGHKALVELEKKYQVHVVTQNVDNLHELAGSSHIVHLHGELTKVRSTVDERLVYDWTEDLNIGDLCDKGSQLRPHIVWFGEAVPKLEEAARLTAKAEVVLIIGTSMNVYPAASLVAYAKPGAKIFYIDPNPNISAELAGLRNLEIVKEVGSVGVPKVVAGLML